MEQVEFLFVRDVLVVVDELEFLFFDMPGFLGTAELGVELSFLFFKVQDALLELHGLLLFLGNASERALF